MCLGDPKRMAPTAWFLIWDLNEFVDYQHFKTDNILTALKLMWPKCFMASVDLKDGNYSVPIASEDRTFLKFEWEGNYYQYTCLPNGLACAPRLFTKILKPIYAHTLWAMSVWSILTIHFLWDILAVPANKTSKTQSNVLIVLGLLFTQKNRCWSLLRNLNSWGFYSIAFLWLFNFPPQKPPMLSLWESIVED